MKLLEEFKRQVGTLGEIKRVWLTSFNLNIEFIETHVLPVVLGMDPPKNRFDYEALQQELNNKGIDFRVFADKRMLSTIGDRKRTAIAITGVSPRQIPGFSRDSLFHPKVVYLQNADGKAILGCGSANLTQGGWGTNQEVYVFRPVATESQAKQAHAFFAPLFETAAVKPVDTLAPSYWGTEMDWEFCHSFQDAGLIARLAARQDDLDEMAIWSPYFSGDLAALLQAIRKEARNPQLIVSLVPDRNESNHIRTSWSPALQQEIDAQTLLFYQSRIPLDERSKLCHAKVWLTPAAIAIGSWNCTKPGAQLTQVVPSQPSANNIEAGMVLPSSLKRATALGTRCDVTAADFCTQSDLDQNALQVPPDLPFDIKVSFDWRTQLYEICITWLEKAQHPYQLRLPDLAPFPIEQPSPSPAVLSATYHVAEPHDILSNHYFIVECDAVVVFLGVIDELKAEYRRSESYQTMDDLLESLVKEPEAGDAPGTVLRGIKSSDDEESIDLADESIAGRALSSYFRLFHALHNYRVQFQECNELKDLERRVLVRPGCLKELRDKITMLEVCPAESIYRWFLTQEFNAVLRAAQESPAARKNEATVIDWPGLALPVQAASLSAQTAQYMEHIRKACEYV